MIQYKDHVITPTVTHFPAAGEVPHVAYSILKDGALVRDGIVYGPFNTLNEAFFTAEAAARGWIDQQAKQRCQLLRTTGPEAGEARRV